MVDPSLLPKQTIEVLDKHDGVSHFDLGLLKVFNCERRKFG